MRVTEEAVLYAAKRMTALAQVNYTRPKAERGSCLELAWEAVGVDEALLDDLYRAGAELTEEHGPFLSGVLFGLFIRQFDY